MKAGGKVLERQKEKTLERRRKGRDRGDRKGNKITKVLGNARGAC